ncbi:MAG: porin [Pseudomonadota bacterium]
MNFKTSAIALAVAGTVAAPVAVQAGADEIYASARVGIENVDTAGTSDLRVRSYGSRFGMRGETDLGNGLTGFGRYEWDVDFADHGNDSDDDIDLRHRYTGIKGDFGSLLFGQTYHTFYNHVVGPVDNPWWGSGYAMVNYRGRTGNAITYAGSTGAVSFGVTGYFVWETEEDAPDQTEFGASFGVGDMTLGVALQSSETAHGSAGTDDDIIGVALSGIALGDASLALNFMSQEDDTSLTVDVGIGNVYVHVEQHSVDATDADRLSTTIGYTQSLGRKTTMWYEFVNVDNDTGNSDDDVGVLRAVLKYDII